MFSSQIQHQGYMDLENALKDPISYTECIKNLLLVQKEEKRAPIEIISHI